MSTSVAQPIEDFRDHLSIVDEKGKRKWIYPRFQAGKIFTRRTVAAYVMLAALIAGPFIQVNGHPLFLFNVVDRIFIVWGIPFFPQDFFLFGFAMITFMVFVILFTSVFGRWWCGWACPQTIFMEFVFRKIEFWIEGDAQKRKLLDRQEWNGETLVKKTLKHAVYLFISFFISNIFLAYIIGIDELKRIIAEPVGQHFIGFVAILVFSLVFYSVFAYLREMVCIGICPYGRLQGVLLDKDSMVVSYDFQRGEPRGKVGTTSGDCVDCHLCVAVCPTGIDIRNGTQLECINCAACIDACNSIMPKVNRPGGLIRIASYNQVEKKRAFRLTTRMAGYAILWTLLVSLLSYLVFSRSVVEATVLRAPGQLFQKKESGLITNLYTVNLVNKSFEDRRIELKVVSPANATLEQVGEAINLSPSAVKESAFFVALPAQEIQNMKTPLTIAVYSGNEKVEEVKTTFIGPVYRKQSGGKSE
jgi:cytochrome c oxidase accessory protein FixG